MSRADNVQSAVRLNHARQLLRRGPSPPAVTARLARIYSISPRQAYRYVQEAQALKRPVPVPESRVAFTVKLPPTLLGQLRRHARTRRQRLSEVVEQALRRQLSRRTQRG